MKYYLLTFSKSNDLFDAEGFMVINEVENEVLTKIFDSSIGENGVYYESGKYLILDEEYTHRELWYDIIIKTEISEQFVGYLKSVGLTTVGIFPNFSELLSKVYLSNSEEWYDSQLPHADEDVLIENYFDKLSDGDFNL